MRTKRVAGAGAAGHERTERELWNERAAAWEKFEAVLMNALNSVNPFLFRALELAPGQRVLDLGCGTGDPALATAQWVGPRGRVLGLDNSEGMLAVARRRARLLELGNVTFRRADMDRLRLPARRFHRAVARYSLMFTDHPVAVLSAVRSSLVPGGILAAAVWGPIKKNPVAIIREEAALPFLDGPPPDPEESANPMRLARPGLLERFFEQAGFRGVRSEAAPGASVYPSVDDFVQIQLGSSLADLWSKLGPADRRRLKKRLTSRFRRFESGPVARAKSHSWVVSGRR